MSYGVMPPEQAVLGRRRPRAREVPAYKVKAGDVLHRVGPFPVLAVGHDEERGKIAARIRCWYPTGEPYEMTVRWAPMRAVLISR